MLLLRRAIHQEYRLKTVFAIVLMAGGLVFGYVFFKQKNILATFGLIGMLIGLRMMKEVWRQPKPEDDRLWQMLVGQSRQIVWVYSVKTQLMPFGLYLWERGTMYFKLADGGELTISLPAGKLKMVSKFLNRLLPHASFGFSEERHRQFGENPSSLLRKDEGMRE